MPKNPYISHVEWCCLDVERCAEFFHELFGWNFKPFGNNYLLCTPKSGPAIGLLRRGQIIQGENCLVFVTVESIETTLQRAKTLGGDVLVEKTRIPDYGWYAQLRDLEGNIVGLFEKLD
jgi:predicted enzyme related to lactoylglutathione lyase